MFTEYAVERAERMRRLRIVARLTTLRESAFGDDGYALRAGIHERLRSKPDLGMAFATGFVGPDVLPAEVYAPEVTSALVGNDIWHAHP